MLVKFKKIVGSWFEPCDDEYSQEYDYEEEPRQVELTAQDLADYFCPIIERKSLGKKHIDKDSAIAIFNELLNEDLIYEEALEEDDDFQDFMRDRYEGEIEND